MTEAAMSLLDKFIAPPNEMKLTREEVLAALVVKNLSAGEEKRADGGVVLSYPVELTGIMKFLHRFSSKKHDKLTRRVELDKAGADVWRLADGSHTVSDIAANIAGSYHVPAEEAEKSTVIYIRMLAERGLVQLVIGEEPQAVGESNAKV
jgi:hypothetical protein